MTDQASCIGMYRPRRLRQTSMTLGKTIVTYVAVTPSFTHSFIHFIHLFL